MKVTFPYLGPVVAYQLLFERLGHEVILPVPPSHATTALGVKYSPEFICFPFKMMLGTYLEAVSRGAEIIVTSGGIGACRAVYYGDLSDKILRQLGYQVRVLVFDTMFENGPAFYRGLNLLRNGKSAAELIAAAAFAVRFVFISDRLERQLEEMRCRELIPGSCRNAWREIQGLLGEVRNPVELKRTEKKAERIIQGLRLRTGFSPLRVGLVGEIYYAMESSTTVDLLDYLATLGVQVVRSRYLSDWVKHCIFPPRSLLRGANRFLRYEVGGHEKENIGYMIDYAERGFDGVLHLLPFGCMPELVTQTIIPALTAEFDFPILSLSLDEHTGWTNHRIRLEAFVDLMRNRSDERRERSGSG